MRRRVQRRNTKAAVIHITFYYGALQYVQAVRFVVGLIVSEDLHVFRPSWLDQKVFPD